VYKRDYAFRMNVMEEIFEIRSCIDIPANDIEFYTADDYMLYIIIIIIRHAPSVRSSACCQ